MSTFHVSDLPILVKGISALNNLHGDRTIAGDGLGDADISGLTNPGTVTRLITAVDALAGFHVSDLHARRFASNAIAALAGRFFKIAAPVIGTVTLADSGGSLPDSTTYYYAVCAKDRSGNLSYPSAEASKATGTGGAGNVHVTTIPWTEPTGGFTYRVFRGIAAGTYVFYKDVTDAASTTHASDAGWTATTTTLAALQAAGTDAYFGGITDDMVDDARDAGSLNFATLRNSVADQHPDSTARTFNLGGSLSVGTPSST